MKKTCLFTLLILLYLMPRQAYVQDFGSRVRPYIETEAGLPLEQAIKSATFNGAKYLNLDQEIGTIETGKKADLVVIDGDPTQNVQELRKVQLVFKDGVGFNSEKIFEATKGKVGVH